MSALARVPQAKVFELNAFHSFSFVVFTAEG